MSNRSSAFNFGSTMVVSVLGLAAAAVVGATAVHRRQRRKRTKQKKTVSSDDIIPLSSQQMYFVECADKGMDHIVACVEISSPEHTTMPTARSLQTALDVVVQQRDPNLANVLVLRKTNEKKEKTSVVVLLNVPSVSGHLTTVVDQDWQSVAHESLNTIQFPKPITEEDVTPTWKVLWVPSSVDKSSAALIFILHHAVFDGTSRNRLIQAILEALEDQSKGHHHAGGASTTASTKTIPAVSRPLVAANITSNTNYMTWRQFGGLLYRSWKFFNHHRHIPAWYMDLTKAPGSSVTHDDSDQDVSMTKQTKQILVRLSTEETQAVMQRCKREGTTVHGALSASALLALWPFGRKNTEEVCKEPSTMTCGHLISLWKELADHIPAGSLTGCFVAVHTTTTVMDPSQDAWQMARDIKADLQTFAPRTMTQFVISILWNRLLLALFGKSAPPEYRLLQRVPSVTISNNGRVAFGGNSYAGISVEGCYATSSRHDVPGSLAVMNVQTVASRLCISLSYYTHVWSDETANRYMKRLRQSLNGMAS